MYFRLNDDTYLVKGAKRGAFYNLKNGEVYSINSQAMQMVDALEKGERIVAVADKFLDIGQEKLVAYLDDLQKENLGRIYDEPHVQLKDAVPPNPNGLEFVWLELREDCNHRCLHCYSESDRKETRQARLSKEEWVRVIKEIKGTGCDALQFIGGEPMLFGRDVFYLAEKVRELEFKDLEIFSNLTAIQDDWIDLFAKLQIRVATSIYSKRPEIHDRVTQIPGSHQRMLKNAAKLKEKGVKVRFCCIAMKPNQDSMDETMEFLKDLGEPNPSYDIVRPTGRGSDRDLQPEKLVGKRREGDAARPKTFPKIKREEFLRRYNGNPCFWGKIAISSTGDIFPCVMQRSESCGNVRTNTMAEILQGPKLGRYWTLSLDKIEVCRDCEYRYACHDCRPICEGYTGNFLAKPFYCHYDPYQGSCT